MLAGELTSHDIFLIRTEQKKRLDEALVATERLVSYSEVQKDKLWRAFVITACQALRLAIKTWNLENESEDML